MNIVALVGNLATDPECRTVSGERKVCTFRLAVSRTNGQEADFFTVVAWERNAEVCESYLSIGRRIAITGRLHHSTWEVESGVEGEAAKRRSRVEVVAHRIDLLGAPKRESKPADDDADPFAGEAVATGGGTAESTFAVT